MKLELKCGKVIGEPSGFGAVPHCTGELVLQEVSVVPDSAILNVIYRWFGEHQHETWDEESPDDGEQVTGGEVKEDDEDSRIRAVNVPMERWEQAAER